MKKESKRGLNLFLATTIILFIVLSLSFSFVSASWFSDFWGKITGNAITAPSNGLIAYYPFDNNVNDYSGNNYNGGGIGVSFVDGKIGKAGSFSSGSYVSVASKSSLETSGEKTISLWVKPTSSTGTIISKYESDTYEDGFNLGVSSGFIKNAATTGFSASYNLPLNTWSHVAYTWNTNSGKLRVYVNGVFVSESNTISGGFYGNNAPLIFGASIYGPSNSVCYWDSCFYKGLIDEARIYNRILSDDEIKGLAGVETTPTPVTCTSFTYSAWSECSSSGTQTRTVASSSPSGCTGGSPVLSQACTYTAPVTCTDSDGGLNYYVKGKAEQFLGTGNSVYVEDYCYTPHVLTEGFCSGSYRNQTDYSCPNGCVAGACVNSTNLANVSSYCDANSCVLYEGDKVNPLNNSVAIAYISQGNVKLIVEGVNTRNLQIDDEHYVGDVTITITGIFSSSKTTDSSYIEFNYVLNTLPTQTCQAFIDKIKSPADFKDYSGQLWINRGSWNYTGRYWVNNVDEPYNQYSSYWYGDNLQDYRSFSAEVLVFDNKNVDLSTTITWQSTDYICKADNVANQNIYVCNWDIRNNRQSTDSYQYKSRQVYWYNDNVLVQLYFNFGKSLTDAEITALLQKRVGDLINTLQDNQYKYVDWDNFQIDSPSYNALYEFLKECNSDLIINYSNVLSWNCKKEPALCPPHGEQKQICQAWNPQTGNYETQESISSCNPGICSGCMIPKWFGNNWDSKCIPYGFRFEQDSGKFNLIEENWTSGGYSEDSGKISLEDIKGDEDEVFVQIYPNNTLSIRVLEWGNATHLLAIGDKLDILKLVNLSLYHDKDIIQYSFQIDSIYYDSQDYLKSYFSYTLIMESPLKTYNYTYQKPILFNMYCDIDGRVKQQKTKDWNGEWAKCQNNYECSSNLCSDGECIELKDIAASANVFKVTFVRVICKLANLFDQEDYAQCIYNYLGDEEVKKNLS
jgi:hypothetical protein